MRRLTMLILSALFIVSLLVACGGSGNSGSGSGSSGGKGVDERGIGLRKTFLADESKTTTPRIQYSKANPGQSTKIARAFENAPPMIPHNVENFLPIKRPNICVTCHMPNRAKASGATPIPKSHLYNLRENQRSLGGKLNDARHECTMCHAAQSDAKLVVGNTFRPEFRSSNGKSRSNLMKNINEGVR